MATDENGMGVHAELNTGRTVLRLGMHWPIVHLLSRYPYGWVISRDVCQGDVSIESRAYYDTEGEARAAWRRLLGGASDHVAIADAV